MRKRWMIGGIAFFLIWIFPLVGFCQKATIRDVSVKGMDGVWKVSFDVENCFTEKMEEASSDSGSRRPLLSIFIFTRREVGGKVGK